MTKIYANLPASIQRDITDAIRLGQNAIAQPESPVRWADVFERHTEQNEVRRSAGVRKAAWTKADLAGKVELLKAFKKA